MTWWLLLTINIYLRLNSLAWRKRFQGTDETTNPMTSTNWLILQYSWSRSCSLPSRNSSWGGGAVYLPVCGAAVHQLQDVKTPLLSSILSQSSSESDSHFFLSISIRVSIFLATLTQDGSRSLSFFYKHLYLHISGWSFAPSVAPSSERRCILAPLRHKVPDSRTNRTNARCSPGSSWARSSAC